MGVAVTERVSARVLLVTLELDVLLFSSLDPGEPDRPRHWFSVGGGVEEGESLEKTAVREVLEETGHRLSAVGERLLTRHASYDFEGEHFEQEETIFVAWVERFEPSTEHWTDVERRADACHRWWSIDELTDTDEVVWPENLATLLRTLEVPSELG
jgi:8-oxo-dGTP pyrophosphatase MutT (NUDIX family)